MGRRRRCARFPAQEVLQHHVEARRHGRPRLLELDQVGLDGQVQRADGTITLLDESRSPVMQWRFRRGWPCHWTGPTLNATKNEVASKRSRYAMKASKSTSHDMPARRRRSERPQAEPAPVTRSAEVVLDVEVDGDRVHLVLANCGDAVATDIQVEFSCALMGLGGSIDLSTLPVFTRMGVLRPGRTLRIFWDAAICPGRTWRQDSGVCRSRVMDRAAPWPPARRISSRPFGLRAVATVRRIAAPVKKAGIWCTVDGCMGWLRSFVVACITGILSLFASGYVADLAVSWYQISSFEGGSGYFVVFMALVGGAAGFVVGLITSRAVAARPKTRLLEEPRVLLRQRGRAAGRGRGRGTASCRRAAGN